MRINRSIEIVPTPLDFDIGFIDFTRIEGLSIILFPEMIENFAILLNPTINHGVTDINASSIQEFLNFTIAQVTTEKITTETIITETIITSF